MISILKLTKNKELIYIKSFYLDISGLSKLLDDSKIPFGGRFERFSAILR